MLRTGGGEGISRNACTCGHAAVIRVRGSNASRNRKPSIEFADSGAPLVLVFERAVSLETAFVVGARRVEPQSAVPVIANEIGLIVQAATPKTSKSTSLAIWLCPPRRSICPILPTRANRFAMTA